MKLYRTEYEGDPDVVFSWQGTQADAKAARKELEAKSCVGVKTEDVDVPTDKPGLLAWLNENVTGKE